MIIHIRVVGGSPEWGSHQTGTNLIKIPFMNLILKGPSEVNLFCLIAESYWESRPLAGFIRSTMFCCHVPNLLYHKKKERPDIGIIYWWLPLYRSDLALKMWKRGIKVKIILNIKLTSTSQVCHWCRSD